MNRIFLSFLSLTVLTSVAVACAEHQALKQSDQPEQADDLEEEAED
jgi:hypothetical protein